MEEDSIVSYMIVEDWLSKELVRQALRIHKRYYCRKTLKYQKILIGLTIIAFGTSAPEFAASLAPSLPVAQTWCLGMLLAAAF